ncbi:hypothetical protein M8818_003401 [Zalaria obscura]|uniref:Uncharacterized protein n=1 Tax=Zalaria obscura TaxID=2024903 RepID=A0ACC3SEZ7_9PEZI
MLSILRKARLKDKEMRILMLGLDNAGKTTIVKKIMNEDINTVSPTLGFIIKTIDWDGGCRRPEDPADVLEELLREDGYVDLGRGRDGPGADRGLQGGASRTTAARTIDGRKSARSEEQERRTGFDGRSRSSPGTTTGRYQDAQMEDYAV